MATKVARGKEEPGVHVSYSFDYNEFLSITGSKDCHLPSLGTLDNTEHNGISPGLWPNHYQLAI